MRSSFAILGLLGCSLASAQSYIVTGTTSGVLGEVNVMKNYNVQTGTYEQGARFVPFLGSSSGINVATGDIDGDGIPEIIAATADAFNTVGIFDLEGHSKGGFLPFGSSYANGVSVAAGDFDGDGKAEIVIGSGANLSSVPRVKMFSGLNGQVVADFSPFSPVYNGGVRVAMGDLNGDGKAELITGAGGDLQGPEIKVFNQSLTATQDFYGNDPGALLGIQVATGDMNGDGLTDIVGAANSGVGGQVRAFDGRTLAPLAAFDAFDTPNLLGIRIAAGDLDGDGVAEVMAVNQRGGSGFRVFNGRGTLLGSGDGNWGSVAFASVPEPSSFAVLCVGGLLALRRRKKQSG